MEFVGSNSQQPSMPPTQPVNLILDRDDLNIETGTISTIIPENMNLTPMQLALMKEYIKKMQILS